MDTFKKIQDYIKDQEQLKPLLQYIFEGPEARHRLEEIELSNLARNILLIEELKAILKRFMESGIEAAVLKGPALSEHLYPYPWLRTFGDLDILIRGKDIGLAENILLNMGYKPATSKLKLFRRFYRISSFKFQGALYIKHAWIPVVVELHRTIGDYPHVLNLTLERLRNRLLRVDMGGVDMFILPQEELLVKLCIHMHHHGDSFSFSPLDIFELLRQRWNEIDWEHFLKIVKQEGIQLPVLKSLWKVLKIFHIPILVYVISELINQDQSKMKQKMILIRSKLRSRYRATPKLKLLDHVRLQAIDFILIPSIKLKLEFIGIKILKILFLSDDFKRFAWKSLALLKVPTA